MNLTLLPITALLVLLSGMGTPASARGQHATAWMKELLRTGNMVRASVRVTPERTRLERCRAGAERGWRGLAPARGLLLPGAFAERVAAARAVGGRMEQKQYRTRFGFADGAYLAVGPPTAGACARLG